MDRKKGLPKIVGDLEPGDLCIDETEGYVRVVLEHLNHGYHHTTTDTLLYQITPVVSIIRWISRAGLTGLSVYRNGKIIY